jgi:hypothetical protein
MRVIKKTGVELRKYCAINATNHIYTVKYNFNYDYHDLSQIISLLQFYP